jgi:DNA-binding NtrC family response regulator
VKGILREKVNMKTILILDDEPEIGMLLAAIIKAMGLTAIQSTTIADARSEIRNYYVDLLIIDNQLSDGIGIEEVPNMVKLKPNMRIAMMSAFDSKEIINMVNDGTVIAFLNKPFSRKDVVSMIEKVFPDLALTH